MSTAYHLRPDLSVFHCKPASLLEVFAGLSVVQLEVVAEIPWLSDLSEPT